MLDFTNTKIAFEGKSDTDLRSAEFLFRAMASHKVVKTGKYLSLIAQKINFPVGWALRPTIYKHFVGGESLEHSRPTLEELGRRGVKAVLDYSAEGGSTDKDIEATYNETVRSLMFAKGNPNISHGVFKPSGIGPVDVLKKYCEGETLSEAEQTRLAAFRSRFMELCRLAYENDIRILVDAEHVAYQQIVDDLTDEAMARFNKQKAVVFATLQMYRHDRMPYLQKIYKAAEAEGFYPGIKFVRGAYMDEERRLAREAGRPDPICPDKVATDANYDEGVHYVLERISRFELFIGTHNESSCRQAAELIDTLGLQRNDQRIYFAQLYGMSDILSYNLSAAGYNVTKYLPYAPVDRVLPYLIRRAEENTAIKGQTARELELIRKELRRRRREQKA